MRLILVLTCLLPLAGLAKRQPPNIILICADDLGYGDVSYHHGHAEDIITPNIERLARNGVWFSQAYSASTLGAPARSGMMTGRYPQRYGYEDNPGPFRQSEDVTIGTPDSETTLAEKFGELGYTTALIGKYEDSYNQLKHPNRRGYDYFYGFTGSIIDYYVKARSKRQIYRNNKLVIEQRYLTDVFGEEAEKFIIENKDDPFFLHLSFNAVSGPIVAPPEVVEKFAHIQGERRRKFVTMLYIMDKNIGNLLNTLNKHGLKENTMVILTSDTGSKPRATHASNGNLNGERGTFFEGGIRVPLIISWPSKLPKDFEHTQMVSTLDIYPTIFSACKARKPWSENELDGKDIYSQISGMEDASSHEYLYWRANAKWAVRDNHWKLVFADNKSPVALYKIINDEREQKNVINDYPAEVERLNNAFVNWSKTLKAPQWGWQPQYCGETKMDFKNPNPQALSIAD
ncbi:sulfatase family protein [Persicirhabdus sediminis]|uniref:Sulfatase-like hydrolase/transferase n=1 Tax=Persicirhabdus sediminis TaxID=454144 RepID=A0A8J7MC78_9BACT|nr:sulfatase-like hydrolase/transferase [Persicirhabdus sediminis]MBK1789826.1 sulfatase-like hydrolase/transferase [Persicirhabdus sediminis]